ncbi:MAG: hypothetical protein KIH67_003270 [Candidatus Moranbacteria bacterium]|nr:hypothetical protein [Candidatus Moranbacteria bacterium]
MAGINLSQSTTERKVDRRKFFDAGMVFSSILLLIVLAAWGGIYYLSMKTTQEIASLQNEIDTSGVEMKGPKIDRILDFDTRIEMVSKNIESQVDASEMLVGLEELVIPSIRLTNYEYDHENGNVTIEGITSDFKFLAQQLISLKKNEQYANIRVDKIGNSESGDIVFTLKSEGLK